MQNREDIAGSKSTALFSEPHEKKIVLLLCVLAAVHVFIFSAVFPFFNNVDEAIHFDLVLKYSHGHIPQRLEPISGDSAAYLALMNCHEYFAGPDQFPGGRFPSPAWTLPPENKHQDLTTRSANWQTQLNYEVSQPPLYYAIAGLWWHVGEWLGFHEGRLVYWLRFLNIVVVIGLVWLGYVAARMIFPENYFLRLGAPALIAFISQSAFYSIGNDVLSPLCFGITFVCLIQWLRAEKSSVGLGAATGLAFAATYLSKMTNLSLLIVAAAAVLIKAALDIRRGKLKTTVPPLVAFLCCAEIPIIVWMMWCKSSYGDLTGSAAKAQFLGWTVKPFTDWWHHPIFTPSGLWTYLSGELSTFWQGEFVWHHQRMALPASRVIFTIFSLVLMVLALPGLFARSNSSQPQRHSLQLSLACFAAALGFFGLLSIIYDFHDCPDPSRVHPYFSAGRMMLGMLIPFLLLFVYGLDRVLNHFGNAAKFFTLAIMISAMLITEIATDWPVFFNEYNWFHLP